MEEENKVGMEKGEGLSSELEGKRREGQQDEEEGKEREKGWRRWEPSWRRPYGWAWRRMMTRKRR